MHMVDLARGAAARRTINRVETDTLVIGFVNNMSGAAAAHSERQFRLLVQSAALNRHVVWRRYGLPGAAGGPLPAADAANMAAAPQPDAIIISGAEPRTATLQHEPFWPGLCRLLDWAEARAVPLLLSCLAAHAALLHTKGIERRPLPAKRSGVFAVHPVAGHVLLRGLPATILMPHSRRHAICPVALRQAGCTILTSSESGEIDMALRDGAAPWLMLQGHPEYEAETLFLEYRRDLTRHLAEGASGQPPAIPTRYLHPTAEARLLALPPETRALSAHQAIQAHPIAAPWAAPARTLFENWLNLVSDVRSARASVRASA